jgi:deazaflavin-dependent oxidoreductase (nitroreductase family)
MNDPDGSPAGMAEALSVHASAPFCYLTTIGRVTGKPHEIEIWFALIGNTAYLMSGEEGRGVKADWVRNLRKQAAVKLRIENQTFDATAREVKNTHEDALARRLLLEKYATPQDELQDWGRTALPIAIELHI